MNAHESLLLGGFASAAVVAYGLTWLARVAAPQLGYVDKPDGGRKRHSKATPLLGGVAVYVAFAGTLAACLAFGDPNWLRGDPLNLGLLVGSGGLFCLLGMWDDRSPLRARDKFLLQILASLPLAIWGPHIEVINVVGFHFELGPWSLLFTVFWLVSCANVVNLVDGLDGLASSVGLIAVGTLAVVSLGHPPIVSLVALTFAGSIVGFLVHNWPPARIFLGDAGSLTIGFMVGAIAIESSHKTTAGFMLVLPLALLSIPILDTSMAILRRKLTGRGIGEADRGHIHHRLQDRGLSKLQTLLAIVGICSTMAAACLLAFTFGHDLIAVVACVGVLAIIVAGRIFGFHEMMLVFRHFAIVHSAVTEAVRDMSIQRMVFRMEHSHPVSLDALWETVFTRVEHVGGLALEMKCTCDDEEAELLAIHWSSIGGEDRRFGEWEVRYTVPRADGLRTTFSAKGLQMPGQKTQSLDQLTQVFEACSRHLPSIEQLRERDTVPSIHPLSHPEFAAVPARNAAARRRAA